MLGGGLKEQGQVAKLSRVLAHLLSWSLGLAGPGLHPGAAGGELQEVVPASYWLCGAGRWCFKDIPDALRSVCSSLCKLPRVLGKQSVEPWKEK